MAFIDKKRNILVLRIVYDGPGMSGKTTTLRSLAGLLGVEVITPKEQNGRTLFFDWVDYTGGLFEGRQICCQIVTVPGQEELIERRQLLLESADSVVFVADTRNKRMNRSLRSLRTLVDGVGAKDPPVGIVLQANKRDQPLCISMPILRPKIIKICPMAIIETVATDGVGVREAFVFAVRLALDRIRILADRGELSYGDSSEDASGRLLQQLSATNAPASLPIESTLDVDIDRLDTEISSVAAIDNHADKEEREFVPDPMMPCGFIWPPVNGRSLLFEVAQLDLQPVQSTHGDWWATGAGWRLHSIRDAKFEDPDDARKALIAWARLHVSCSDNLSTGRTVVLVERAGRYRLWQLVRMEASLREELATYEDSANPDEIATLVHSVASELLRVRSDFETDNLRLPCTLWSIGLDQNERGVYVDLMPEVGGPIEQELIGPELVAREFLPVLRDLAREYPQYDIKTALQRRLQKTGADLALEALVQIAQRPLG